MLLNTFDQRQRELCPENTISGESDRPMYAKDLANLVLAKYNLPTYTWKCLLDSAGLPCDRRLVRFVTVVL